MHLVIVFRLADAILPSHLLQYDVIVTLGVGTTSFNPDSKGKLNHFPNFRK